MNDKLLFQHLPKCGGSTFRRIIYRKYQPKNTFSINVINDVKLNTEDFINLSLEKRDQIHLLHGHMKFGLHKYMTGDPRYITFLRTPEDRIVSYYHFVLRSPTHRLYKQVMSERMTLYDFVTKINQGDVNNGQIMFISGIEDTEELMLEKALENIENHFSFVGTVEKFNESLILLKKKYDWPIPYYRVLNRTKDRKPLSSIDNKTREVIRNLNNGDTILYNKIHAKLNDLIKDESFLKLELLKLSVYNKMYSNNILRAIVSKMKNLQALN